MGYIPPPPPPVLPFLLTCAFCGTQRENQAKACPSCGAYQIKGMRKRTLTISQLWGDDELVAESVELGF
jgi:hypothetical protein